MICFENQLDNIDLNEFLTVISHRKVDNGNTIKYKNKYCKIYADNSNPVYPHSKDKCLVIQKFNGELVVMFEQNIYHLEEFQKVREDSLFEDVKPKIRKEYRPGLNHPWKRKFYEEYLRYYRKKKSNL